MADAYSITESAYLSRLKDVEDTLKHVDNKVAKIYVAVIGDEKFDQKGIIDRLKSAEGKIEEFSALKNKLIGAFVVGGIAWTVIWEALQSLFNK